MKNQNILRLAASALMIAAIGAASVSAQRPPIQGKVERVELNLEKLRDVGIDLKHLLKASSSLYDEVTIQPVRLITQPEVIGHGMIINVPVSTEPVGPPRPARKDRVDLFMGQIRPITGALKTNVDEFVNGDKQLDLPDDVLQKIRPDLKNWVAQVNSMAEHETNLEALTKGPTYDNQLIAEAATALQKDVNSLDKTRRNIYNAIRKQGKRISAFLKAEHEEASQSESPPATK